MNDPALALIINILNERSLNTLLVIDENCDVSQLKNINKPNNITAITQRFDQHQQLQKMGFKAHLSDYNFSNLAADKYAFVAMRIGKQKAISHHVINQAYSVLRTSGQLILAGGKQEGIQSIAKKLKAIAPAYKKTRAKGQNEAYIFDLYPATNSFDDSGYKQLRPAAKYEDTHFLSKPGLYGWQKIDTGSALLIDGISSEPINEQHSLLDLGCGYGFLSVMAARNFGVNVTATDNNIAAVNACNANLQHFNCKGVAINDDCANNISDTFNVVLCNPPFHSGFSTNHSLTERFLSAARNHLCPDGTAYFVVNDFIPLAKKAASLFNSIELLNTAGGFNVFRLKNA